MLYHFVDYIYLPVVGKKLVFKNKKNSCEKSSKMSPPTVLGKARVKLLGAMVNLITARPTQPVTTCLKIHHRSGRFSRKRQGARPEKIGMSPEKTEIELVKIEKAIRLELIRVPQKSPQTEK